MIETKHSFGLFGKYTFISFVMKGNAKKKIV